jgi:hypothetical protein
MVSDAQRGVLAVQYAVRTGKLTRVTERRCLDCGVRAQQYHHHRGYQKEHLLNVVPLCTRCHGKRHALTPAERVLYAPAYMRGEQLPEYRLTLAQVAERFRLPLRSVQYAVQHGTLRAERIGHFWVTTAAEVGNWIAHGPHRPGRPAKGTKRQERHAHDGSDG